MKKQKTIPTFLAILLLVSGIVAGVFLVQTDKIFQTNASLDPEPMQVKITNVTDRSFSVVWSTDKISRGFIAFGDSKSLGQVAPQQGNLPETSTFIHHTSINNLSPNTVYYFKIGIDDKLFDNSGELYQIKTGQGIEITPKPDVIFGRVVDQLNKPITDAVVLVAIDGVIDQSAITDIEGKWSVPLSTARNTNLNSYATYSPNSLIEITAMGLGKTSSAKAKISSAYPIPTIILGQNQDFTNFSPLPDKTVPDAQFKFY